MEAEVCELVHNGSLAAGDERDEPATRQARILAANVTRLEGLSGS